MDVILEEQLSETDSDCFQRSKRRISSNGWREQTENVFPATQYALVGGSCRADDGEEQKMRQLRSRNGCESVGQEDFGNRAAMMNVIAPKMTISCQNCSCGGNTLRSEQDRTGDASSCSICRKRVRRYGNSNIRIPRRKTKTGELYFLMRPGDLSDVSKGR